MCLSTNKIVLWKVTAVSDLQGPYEIPYDVRSEKLILGKHRKTQSIKSSSSSISSSTSQHRCKHQQLFV